MKKLLLMLFCACFVASCGKQPEVPKPAAVVPPVPALVSGIDMQYIDDSVRPQDDFYRHVNGKWLATIEIPADKASYDPWDKLQDQSQEHRRRIIEELQKSVDAADPDQQKIADLYSSFMDEAALEHAGLEPLDTEFAKIDRLKDKKEIASLIAHFNQIDVSAPYTPVYQDAKDSTKYVFILWQAGLGMPDRDYYLLNDDKLKQARTQYGQHVEKMLTMAGDKAAAKDAKDVVALETELAKVQWTKVENRDPVKTYNKV